MDSRLCWAWWEISELVFRAKRRVVHLYGVGILGMEERDGDHEVPGRPLWTF